MKFYGLSWKNVQDAYNEKGRAKLMLCPSEL